MQCALHRIASKTQRYCTHIHVRGLHCKAHSALNMRQGGGHPCPLPPPPPFNTHVHTFKGFEAFLCPAPPRAGADEEALARLPPLHVLGLAGAYHGDTLGAQDCVAPSVYNARAQAPWYSGRGAYLHPPYIALVQVRQARLALTTGRPALRPRPEGRPSSSL